MKIIRITANNEITIHDFPENVSYSELNEFLRGLIGDDCELYEVARLTRIYEDLGASDEMTREAGSSVVCLVDEDGLSKKLPINAIGSYLYKTELHGYPIVGTILGVGEYWGIDGPDISGLSDQQFNLLYPQLYELAEIVKRENNKV